MTGKLPRPLCRTFDFLSRHLALPMPLFRLTSRTCRRKRYGSAESCMYRRMSANQMARNGLITCSSCLLYLKKTFSLTCFIHAAVRMPRRRSLPAWQNICLTRTVVRKPFAAEIPAVIACSRISATGQAFILKEKGIPRLSSSCKRIIMNTCSLMLRNWIPVNSLCMMTMMKQLKHSPMPLSDRELRSLPTHVRTALLSLSLHPDFPPRFRQRLSHLFPNG